MTELQNNAWLGWQNFTDAGKLAALLAASLIFLWMSHKKVTQKTLVLYTTAVAVCCVVPVTAAGLMLYQTKFYDYQWVWSLVPMTAVIAYGGVSFLSECWPGFRISEWKKGVPVLALLFALLLFSGGMGKTDVDKNNNKAERKAAEKVLTQLRTEMQEEEICLWAPKAILEYARETDASIKLLYGRNMWDEWLNAYTYDVYSEDMVSLYQWMEELALSGQIPEKTTAVDMEKEVSPAGEPGAADRVRMALEAGTNCILLPENVDEGMIKKLENALELRVLSIDGYYLLIA